MLNSFNAVGRITKDVTARAIKGADGKDISTASFTLAVDRRMTKAQREAAEKAKRPTADFITCVAWGKTADVLAEYGKKGQMLAVEGRIETRHYEAKDGHTVYVTECRISDMSFIGNGKKSTAGDDSAPVKVEKADEAEEEALDTSESLASLDSDDLPF